jgi:hypothetical protein
MAGFSAPICWAVRSENMKKKTRKPKKCQWVEGFGHDGVSAWHTCPLKPMFEVQVHGATIAHVCPQHSIHVTQRGYQIR